MKSRALASLALSAAVVLGATGCSMLTPQSTTIHYSAAEGINIADASGPVKVRNLLIVADKSGDNGNLVGNFINPTGETQTVVVQIGEGSSAQSVKVTVDANSAVVLGGTGDNAEDPILLEGIDAAVGGTIKSSITSGGDNVETPVPVLDGKLSYLSDLAPEK